VSELENFINIFLNSSIVDLITMHARSMEECFSMKKYNESF